MLKDATTINRVDKNFGILRLYCGSSGQKGYYNLQEVGLAKALAKRGYSVFIFLLNSELKKRNEEIVSENIRIVHVPAKNIVNHGFFKCSVLLDYEINILQLQSDNQIYAPHVMKFCKKHKINFYNYIGTVFSDSKNYLKRILMNSFSRRNIGYFSEHSTFVKTPHVKDQLKTMGVRNIEVLPVGLDFNVIPQVLESKNALRKMLGLPIKKKILAFVGRLEEYKQPLDILKLMHKLDDRYFLLLIGKGSLKEILFSKIREYKLEGRVKYLEAVPNQEMHSYYKAIDCLINMNQHEIFGMSILEAMYQECPVVARHAPGPNFIIDNGVTGFLCDDLKTMIKSLEKLDENMGIQSKERIINIFNWDSTCEKILKSLTINENVKI
ncbi:glycosyltransferase family 4 protein [Neobacillus niacini]|uniref:glycosyltransferase family 4 protein n=1 Tax=Neobacillus niacini TaxID=86668 RepID=UPI002FFE9BBB